MTPTHICNTNKYTQREAEMERERGKRKYIKRRFNMFVLFKKKLTSSLRVT